VRQRGTRGQRGHGASSRLKSSETDHQKASARKEEKKSNHHIKTGRWVLPKIGGGVKNRVGREKDFVKTAPKRPGKWKGEKTGKKNAYRRKNKLKIFSRPTRNRRKGAGRGERKQGTGVSEKAE